MSGLLGLVCWVIGCVTGALVKKWEHKERATRREFNNVDLTAGTHRKEVGYYLRGERLG